MKRRFLYALAIIAVSLLAAQCRKTYGTNCSDSPQTLNLLAETKFRVHCDLNCALADAPLKGTKIYTADSSFCRAAIHAGEIDNFVGGKVTVEMLPGQNSYQGSERNGITSSNSGASDASFQFD